MSSDWGEHFARSAVLEHASVFAFRHLREQLAMHGAPRRQRWLAQRLDRNARARVKLAYERARAELAQELEARPPEALVDAAGVPDRNSARELFVALERRLW